MILQGLRENHCPAMDLRMLTYYAGKERGIADLRALGAQAGLAPRGVHKVGHGSFMSIVELVPGARRRGPAER